MVYKKLLKIFLTNEFYNSLTLLGEYFLLHITDEYDIIHI